MDRKKTLVPSVIIALLAAALMFLFAFRSCVGQKIRSKSAEMGIAGQYEASSMVANGEETTSEDLSLLKSKGLTCTMILWTDGTGVLNLFGEETALTWDEKTISTGEKELTYTFQDNQLTVTDGDTSLTFSRME